MRVKSEGLKCEFEGGGCGSRCGLEEKSSGDLVFMGFDTFQVEAGKAGKMGSTFLKLRNIIGYC